MNSNDWAVIRQHLQSAICRTVQQFREHPADFLSENDIQAVLFSELRNEMRGVRMKYETSCKKDQCFGKALDISRVMTEYWLAAEGLCDLVVLCDEQGPEAAALWRQPCRIGSEIKFWQALERHNWKEPRGPQQDIDKLQRYWIKRNQNEQYFTGIAMLFRHPGAIRCEEAEEMAGTDYEAAYPENGVAIHVISKEGHWWKTAPVSKLADVTAPNTD
jgi:hypothetical protein